MKIERSCVGVIITATTVIGVLSHSRYFVVANSNPGGGSLYSNPYGNNINNNNNPDIYSSSKQQLYQQGGTGTWQDPTQYDRDVQNRQFEYYQRFQQQQLSQQPQQDPYEEKKVEEDHSAVFSQHFLPPLPPGWSEHIDPASGQPYYYNENDGVTTWDRPEPQPVSEVQKEPDIETTQEFQHQQQEQVTNEDKVTSTTSPVLSQTADSNQNSHLTQEQPVYDEKLKESELKSPAYQAEQKPTDATFQWPMYRQQQQLQQSQSNQKHNSETNFHQSKQLNLQQQPIQQQKNDNDTTGQSSLSSLQQSNNWNEQVDRPTSTQNLHQQQPLQQQQQQHEQMPIWGQHQQTNVKEFGQRVEGISLSEDKKVDTKTLSSNFAQQPQNPIPKLYQSWQRKPDNLEQQQFLNQSPKTTSEEDLKRSEKFVNEYNSIQDTAIAKNSQFEEPTRVQMQPEPEQPEIPTKTDSVTSFQNESQQQSTIAEGNLDSTQLLSTAQIQTLQRKPTAFVPQKETSDRPWGVHSPPMYSQQQYDQSGIQQRPQFTVPQSGSYGQKPAGQSGTDISPQQQNSLPPEEVKTQQIPTRDQAIPQRNVQYQEQQQQHPQQQQQQQPIQRLPTLVNQQHQGPGQASSHYSPKQPPNMLQQQQQQQQQQRNPQLGKPYRQNRNPYVPKNNNIVKEQYDSAYEQLSQQPSSYNSQGGTIQRGMQLQQQQQQHAPVVGERALVVANQEQSNNGVKEALGRTWQGIVGLRDKTKEVVGQATETVVSGAKGAQQSIATTGSSWWEVAISRFGSVFETPEEEYSFANLYGTSKSQPNQEQQRTQNPQQQQQQQYQPSAQHPDHQSYPPNQRGYLRTSQLGHPSGYPPSLSSQILQQQGYISQEQRYGGAGGQQQSPYGRQQFPQQQQQQQQQQHQGIGIRNSKEVPQQVSRYPAGYTPPQPRADVPYPTLPQQQQQQQQPQTYDSRPSPYGQQPLQGYPPIQSQWGQGAVPSSLTQNLNPSQLQQQQPFQQRHQQQQTTTGYPNQGQTTTTEKEEKQDDGTSTTSSIGGWFDHPALSGF